MLSKGQNCKRMQQSSCPIPNTTWDWRPCGFWDQLHSSSQDPSWTHEPYRSVSARTLILWRLHALLSCFICRNLPVWHCICPICSVLDLAKTHLFSPTNFHRTANLHPANCFYYITCVFSWSHSQARPWKIIAFRWCLLWFGELFQIRPKGLPRFSHFPPYGASLSESCAETFADNSWSRISFRDLF